jgi:hypothetical protein
MKPFRNIALRFFFLVTAFFCYWQSTFPVEELKKIAVEVSGTKSQQQESELTHSEASTDDQLADFRDNKLHISESKVFLIPENTFLLPIPQLPVWQPPAL